MSALRAIWRSSRPLIAFSDMETLNRGRIVCPRSYGFRQHPGFFVPDLVILSHISSESPFIFPVGNGSLLPFNPWVLICML